MSTLRSLPSATSVLSPLALALGLAGCATLQPALIPAPLLSAPETRQDAVAKAGATQRSERGTLVSEVPVIPDPVRLSTVKPGTPQAGAAGPADLSVAFDQMPLPSFVQVVFGQVLKKNFSLDPNLIARTDLVTLRTGQPQTATQLLETTRLLLKSYGVAVQEMGDFYRIVPDTNQSAYLPEIRRGRAQPDVPLPLRPVFNLVELTAVRFSDVNQWLKAMFGTKLNIQDDAPRNALLLSGQASDVTAALEAIQVLDQPLMRGRSSRLITPVSLGADDLAKKLSEVLTAEGYATSLGGGTTAPISFVPVPASNSLLVFTGDQAVLEHVVAWAVKLDSLENDNRRNGSFFSYAVKYADAQGLARTMQELLASNSSANPGAIGVTPKPPGRIVVNPATNTLIFSSSGSEYAQLLSIMRDLDQPAKSALIEVTIAEVRVTDRDQLGVEWSLNPTNISGGRVIGGTLGGLGQGAGGFTLNFLNNANVVRGNINALASQNRANVLATPRLMARNGEMATIQVGQEVPVITSQQSTGLTTTGGGGGTGVANGVLQTIQYRSTGTILRVKPIIYAGNRIELEVSQEVSSAADAKVGQINSPTISTRRLETKLSIRDGATVLLGGLISRNDSKGETGVPLLKDIPGLGQLFRTNTESKDKTELIMLITPYVIDDDLVAEQVTQVFRKQLGPWAQDVAGPVPPAKVRASLGPVQESPQATDPSSMQLPVVKGRAVDAVSSPPGSTVLPQSTVGGAPTPTVSPVNPADSAAPTPPVGAPTLPVLPPGGRPVTDPKLLEELRRAKEGAIPTAQSTPTAAAPKSVQPTTTPNKSVGKKNTNQPKQSK
jgi:general secretion pathway protein D